MTTQVLLFNDFFKKYLHLNAVEFNNRGSAGNKETVSTKCIWEQSIQKIVHSTPNLR